VRPDFIIFLITPSAHEIYHSILKRHVDSNFVHSSSYESFSSSFDVDLASDLEGRVIRLPYRIEKIVHLLKDQYLINLKKGQQCEINREAELEELPDKQIAQSRWHECLLPYLECEYVDKVERIIEEKIGWDELLLNRNYRLGCKIIVKSILNVLPFEPERIKWINRLKKYIPISPESLELHIQKEGVFILFRLLGQSPLYGDDALSLYRSLLDIYRDHPVYYTNEKLKLSEDGKARIEKICDYLEIWKNTTLSLEDYINTRKNQYAAQLSMVENLIQDYKDNKTSADDLQKIEQIFNEIEKMKLHCYIG
ncbi:MAG TPA: hypothetical protein VKA95_12530, partial [Nitrososphaeraceae archaeon]|nr:hypothetical protein [Nitrososphaeraceae archaeon]